MAIWTSRWNRQKSMLTGGWRIGMGTRSLEGITVRVQFLIYAFSYLTLFSSSSLLSALHLRCWSYMSRTNRSVSFFPHHTKTIAIVLRLSCLPYWHDKSWLVFLKLSNEWTQWLGYTENHIASCMVVRLLRRGYPTQEVFSPVLWTIWKQSPSRVFEDRNRSYSR